MVAHVTPALRLLILVIAVQLGGCAAEPTPEERIRELIREAEVAAEARDTGDVIAFVAEEFRTDQGLAREDLRNYLRALFLRYQSVHLLVKVSSIEVTDDRATAIVFVAMAGQPLSDDNLLMLRADAHRLELGLRERDGDWRVETASWRRARREDLMGGASE
jgi:hypothetical protein